MHNDLIIMSEENLTASAPAPSSSASSSPSSQEQDRTIIIRMWPKTPVLYPMALVALICGIVAQLAGSSDLSVFPERQGESAVMLQHQPEGAGDGEVIAESTEVGTPRLLIAQAENAEGTPSGAAPTAAAEEGPDELQKKRVDRTLALIFFIALFVSLFAICVDLDVRWAIIYTSAIVIVVLLLWILNMATGFSILDLKIMDAVTPMANAKFYLGVFGVWVVLMFMSFLVTRFHYVKVEPKEVVVVGGMLERQQRYDTMRMRYTKEIHDVMEYYLPFVRSGRLIFSFPEQSEAVIIDNVINIRKVAKRLDEVVGATHPH